MFRSHAPRRVRVVAASALLGAHALLPGLLVTFAPVSAGAQVSAGVQASAWHTEQVTYRNAEDRTRLTATLVLRTAEGARAADMPARSHPGVVVLSVAGTDRLVERLLEDGYAVLLPERRGFVEVEPMLRATYSDLSGDVRAAVDYMRSRAEVDPDALAVLAQGDDTPPAMQLSAELDEPVPLVLLAPPALTGGETFRRSQIVRAERGGYGPDDLEALDVYLTGIVEIVLDEPEAYLRRYRLESLRASSTVELPRSAAFPADDRQMHFFASPLWRDRLSFDPVVALSRLRAPALVLIGTEDADTPIDAYLTDVGRALEAGGGDRPTVCLLPGRTRHTFTAAAVDTIGEWLARRMMPPDGAGGRTATGPPSGCLDPAG